ncbi:MAG: RdgB/HAM1 family non-canonical purine NTP pyrophosphatase [Lachnospiraceae bacterium]
MKLTMILATGNANKVREVREIVADPNVAVRSMKEAGVFADADETGSTFAENALLKAEAVAKLSKQAKMEEPYCIVSDDSGLVIDALDGAPGIYSARFMGHDTDYRVKMNALLEKLQGVPDEKRTARFVAAVSCIFPAGQKGVRYLQEGKDLVLASEGTMEGRIAHGIAGMNGFGYDPFFYLPKYGKTSAELAPMEKDAISHRGKAVREILRQIREVLEST